MLHRGEGVSAPKVHYNPGSGLEETGGVNRVASFCGAITHHCKNSQSYVIETRSKEYVTCKNCIRRLNRGES